MMRYINDPENLKIMMNLLRGPSRAVQYEGFHVFKVFVANPNKSNPVLEILQRNQAKLIDFLDKFHTDKGEISLLTIILRFPRYIFPVTVLLREWTVYWRKAAFACHSHCASSSCFLFLCCCCRRCCWRFVCWCWGWICSDRISAWCRCSRSRCWRVSCPSHWIWGSNRCPWTWWSNSLNTLKWFIGFFCLGVTAVTLLIQRIKPRVMHNALILCFHTLFSLFYHLPLLPQHLCSLPLVAFCHDFSISLFPDDRFVNMCERRHRTKSKEGGEEKKEAGELKAMKMEKRKRLEKYRRKKRREGKSRPVWPSSNRKEAMTNKGELVHGSKRGNIAKGYGNIKA